jgi:hypothetical protein
MSIRKIIWPQEKNYLKNVNSETLLKHNTVLRTLHTGLVAHSDLLHANTLWNPAIQLAKSLNVSVYLKHPKKLGALAKVLPCVLHTPRNSEDGMGLLLNLPLTPFKNDS